MAGPRALGYAARVWTLPNLLTLSRVAAVAPVTWAILERAWWPAFIIFALAAATDWFDGRIARARGLVSEFGRFLDPIADKLMVAAALVALQATVLPPVAAWAVAAILVREIGVSGLREHLAPKGVVVHVSALAKWKTALQLVAVGAWLLAGTSFAAGLALTGVALGLLAAAALLTVWTGLEYLRGGMRHMT